MLKYSDRIGYTMHIYQTDQPYIYRIKGDKLTLQVDAGNSPTNAKKFIDECLREDGKKPDLLVLTHWHWDHSFGLDAIDYPVIASAKTQNYLKQVSTWQWSEEAMKHRLETGEDIEFCYDRMHDEYEDITQIHTRLADWTLDGRMTLDLGGITAILETHDSPHTRDALFIYIPEERVLIGGDAEYEDYYDYNAQYEPERLKDFISYIENIDFDTYLRGHDEGRFTKEELLTKLINAL